MYNWMTKWIRRIVDTFDMAENNDACGSIYNLNDHATLARVRQEIKDEIYQMRLDATLAQLCGENTGSFRSWANNPADLMEARFLFAQADRLERELRYGTVRAL